MPIIEIPVTERKLAARMVAMHTWLHKKKCDPLSFETRADGTGFILVRVELERDGLAESFRRTFNPVPILPRDVERLKGANVPCSSAPISRE